VFLYLHKGPCLSLQFVPPATFDLFCDRSLLFVHASFDAVAMRSLCVMRTSADVQSSDSLSEDEYASSTASADSTSTASSTPSDEGNDRLIDFLIEDRRDGVLVLGQDSRQRQKAVNAELDMILTKWQCASEGADTQDRQ